MKYLMTVTIANPDTPAGMSSDLVYKLICTFAHDPNQYGNGHYLRITQRGVDRYENTYDLRYNEDFDPDDKPAFLEKWARNYWSGKNGAYYVKALRIEAAE